MEWIVELEPGNLWIATWSGYPGKTCVKESAKTYKSISAATYALAHARRYSDWLRAKVAPLAICGSDK